MSKIGRQLRGAGYGVNVSRGSRQWEPRTQRDRQELARFLADVAQFLPNLGMDTSRNFLESRQMNVALVTLRSAIRDSEAFRKRGCCIKCHVEWEESVVWPYLSLASVKALDADHEKLGFWPSPAKFRRHAALEISLMSQDKVPRSLISEMEEHHASIALALESMGPWGRAYRKVKSRWA